MDLSKLNDEQIKVALKVIESAKKYGVNPEFVLSMVNTESGFKQDAVSPMGALGVMQLMPATARSLKVNPANIDENIDGGMRLLRELMDDKRIGNDPFKVLIGYNTRSDTRSKFFESGNFAELPNETVLHVLKIMKPFGENVPSMSATLQEPEQGGDSNDPYDGEKVPDVPKGDGEEEVKQQGTSPKEAGAVGAVLGTSAGTLYSAKMPVVRLAQRVGMLPGGKPITPADAAALVQRVMTPGQQVNLPERTSVSTAASTAAATSPKKTSGGENWQKSLTGISTPGAQMDKSSLDLAKRMQGTVGIGGTPGFVGGTITPGGIILNPQDAAAFEVRQQAAQQAAAAQATRNERLQQFAASRQAGINERLQQAMDRKATKNDALLRQTLQNVYAQDTPQRFGRNVAGSAPVRGGLAGLGVGFNVQDAYNKFQQEDALGGYLASSAAGTSGLSMVPRLAPVMGPAAIGLTTASQMADDLRYRNPELGDYRLKNPQRAAETGTTGLAAMFPRLFGPLGALVYSGKLNAGEEEELARRRNMPPTISP